MTTEALSQQQAKPPYFTAPARDWGRAIGFLLLCSLAGLKFYPALIFIALLLISRVRWRKDRYFFLVEFIIFCTGSGLVGYSTYAVRPCDFAFIFAAIGIMIYRKNGLVRRITLAMLAYFAVLFILAFMSIEPMKNQITQIRYYLLIIGFFIPLVTFADKDFDFRRLMYVIILHALAICGFYVIDTFVLTGFILTPGSHSWGVSTITAPVIATFTLTRHYPPGLYWLLLLIIPLNYKLMRLRWYHWALIALALVSSRTNSLLFALIVCFVFFRPKIRQVMIYTVIGAVGLTGLYLTDKAIGGSLRLADNIESFGMLSTAVDEEDIADFGSGRVAQILPKWELLYDLKREWIGFGFLNREKTTNPIFQIENQYYSDQSKAEEAATGVEVTEIQTILDVGFIGLIAQMAFYIGVYFMIRRLRYSNYYLCLLVGFEVLGVGGFAGLNGIQYSLLILGMILGGIILADRRSTKPIASTETI
ncbi:MAG: hypothetical protein K2O38_04860 [Muribaculaceae bacterium]|nr:hypothetical protein [Muribaculaceae bacterium]MDE7111213.1 hypothetical protein [Muribaculaceae bacterium]